jgi:pyruvate-ferredoxin/flavodoxin oxidoreductase
VSGLSLPYDPALDIEPPGTVRAVFFGLGSDGTVGANKNIRAPHLVQQAGFVGCHHFGLLDRVDVPARSQRRPR